MSGHSAIRSSPHGKTSPGGCCCSSHRPEMAGSSETRRATARHPVDRGWAWLVMLGALVNQFVVVSFIRAQGMLFIEFLRVYKAPAAATTMTFGLASGIYAVSNFVVASFLMKRFECRTLALAGSLMHSLSITCAAFCSDIPSLCVLYAIVGASRGLILLPHVALLGVYFKRRISLANAVAVMGVSVATLVGTPSTKYLLDNYGLRGTFILLGAISFHSLVASMLMRPPSWYGQTSAEADEDGDETVDVKSEDECERRPGAPTNTADLKLLPEKESFAQNSSQKRNEVFLPDGDSFGETDRLTTPQDTACRVAIKKALMPDEKSGRGYQERWRNNSINDNGSLIHLNLQPVSYSRVLSKSLDILCASSSIKYFSTPDLARHIKGLSSDHLDANGYQGSKSCLSGTANGHKEMYDKRERQTASGRDPVEENTPTVRSRFQKIKSAVANSPYTSPVAIVLIVASGSGQHILTSMNYAPAVGQENGLSEDQIPYLQTIAGISDLVCKFTVGILADMPCVRRVYLVSASQMVVAVCFQLVPLCKGFELMVVMMVLMGYWMGVLQALIPVLAADFLGVHSIAQVLSAVYLLMGSIHFTDHVMVGFLKDTFDSFYPGFHYMGAWVFLSVVLFPILPLLQRRTIR